MRCVVTGSFVYLNRFQIEFENISYVRLAEKKGETLPMSEKDFIPKKKTEVDIELRNVIESDLPIFFEHQLDPEANYMAAFTAENPSDRAAFLKKMSKILADENVHIKTVIYKKQVAGHILCHNWFDEPEISYWIGRQFWGKGIATEALTNFLNQIKIRPLLARVVKDNTGSIRVLEKCGFVKHSEDSGFANARVKEVGEFIFKLE